MNPICFTRERITKKYTFVGFLVKLTEIVFVIVKYKTLASKNVEVSNIWLSSFEEFIWSFLYYRSNDNSISNITCRTNRIRPKIFRKICITKHGSCKFH